MDGENNGNKTPIKMDDLGGKPTIFGNSHIESFHEMHWNTIDCWICQFVVLCQSFLHFI